MARKVLIVGESGSGKSYSARTLPPTETVIICPDEKDPPFTGWRNNYQTVKNKEGQVSVSKSNYFRTAEAKEVLTLLKHIGETRHNIKYVIVDTLTFMQFHSFMSRISEKGWDKWDDLAKETWNLLKEIDYLREDLTVFIMAHTEETKTAERRLTIPGGKLLRDKIKPQAMFTIVLETISELTEEGSIQYSFLTNSHDSDAKSPPGMFPSLRIPNDLKLSLKYIEEHETGKSNAKVVTINN